MNPARLAYQPVATLAGALAGMAAGAVVDRAWRAMVWNDVTNQETNSNPRTSSRPGLKQPTNGGVTVPVLSAMSMRVWTQTTPSL